MIIGAIHIRRFRKLVDQVLECGPGLNVIQGPNDAGKSTLHLAFSAALYPVRPSDVRSYGTWGEEGPGEITIDFEAAGTAYRLRKDFRSRKVMLQSGGSRWDDPREVERRIGEVLGLTSVSLFRATAHISQWDLAGVQKEQQEIGTRLARIVTGGDTDASRVLAALEDKIRKFEVGLRHPSKTPGPLKRDQDRIAALTSDRHRLAHEVEAIERAASERDRLGARIGALEQQVRDDGALLDANRRLHALDARWKELHARATETGALLARVAEATQDADAAERDPAITLPTIDAAALRKLQEAEATVRVLEIADAASTSEPAEGPSVGPRLRLARDRILEWTCGLAAIAVAVGGAMFLAVGQPQWGGGLLALALLLAGGAAAVRIRARAVLREVVVRAEREFDLRRRAAERKRAAEQAADEVRRLLTAAGVSSMQEAQDHAERKQGALHQRSATQRVLQGLLGGRTAEALADGHKRIFVELGAIQAQREDPDLRLRQLDPSAFQRLQTEAESRQRQLTAAREELQRLEGRLSGRLPQEDLARIDEELQETEDRLARQQRFVEILRLTREVLLEAHRCTIVPGKALLEERAGRYLSNLSSGAYDRVAVDENSLAPRVWVGPPKEWADVAAREIGSGAVDQCYLALRLALIDVLCDDRRPPLFLDDPFLAYDEERQGAAIRLLRELARDRQIFLLTCRGDYRAYADHLIVLGEISTAVPAT